MPWDTLRNSGSLCYAIALCLFVIAALNMYDWRADEISYSLQLPYFTLEGTLRDIEPKEFAIGDAIVAPWFLAVAFIALTVVMGMWCARHRALPWHAQGRDPGGCAFGNAGQAGSSPPKAKPQRRFPGARALEAASRGATATNPAFPLRHLARRSCALRHRRCPSSALVGSLPAGSRRPARCRACGRAPRRRLACWRRGALGRPPRAAVGAGPHARPVSRMRAPVGSWGAAPGCAAMPGGNSWRIRPLGPAARASAPRRPCGGGGGESPI